MSMFMSSVLLLPDRFASWAFLPPKIEHLGVFTSTILNGFFFLIEWLDLPHHHASYHIISSF
ncbi:hypothetical protein M5K25_027812 [Dendrobium thyrsiflorum]|uniref:Uncharacterized protein n=1 Tax=Dendrobium thyrsiflorum TaxID=117978 RepID=A0ABD0TUY9_DENTH